MNSFLGIFQCCYRQLSRHLIWVHSLDPYYYGSPRFIGGCWWDKSRPRLQFSLVINCIYGCISFQWLCGRSIQVILYVEVNLQTYNFLLKNWSFLRASFPISGCASQPSWLDSMRMEMMLMIWQNKVGIVWELLTKECNSFFSFYFSRYTSEMEMFSTKKANCKLNIKLYKLLHCIILDKLFVIYACMWLTKRDG